MNNSIKRAQSQARLSFAERENFRPKVRQYKKLMMTLALLLTAVTGAWAEETPLVTIYASNDFKKGSQTFDNKVKATFSQEVAFIADNGWCAVTTGDKTLTVEPVDGVTITRVKYYTALGNAEDITAPFEASMYYTYIPVSGNSQSRFHVSVNGSRIGAEDTHNYLQKIEVYGTAEPPIVVEWNASTKTGTFNQPGSDVVLTPIYAKAAAFATTGTEPEVKTLLPEAAEGVIAGTDAPLIVEGTVAKAGETENPQGTVMYAVTAATATDATELTSSDWKNTVPTAKNIADDGAEVKVWYYIQGADAPQGEAATLDNTFNNSDVCATPLTVTVLSNKFDLTLKAANANTIDATQASKGTVTVGGTDKTGDITEGKLQGVKMGSEVKMTAKSGYKFRKVEVKKAASTPTLKDALKEGAVTRIKFNYEGPLYADFTYSNGSFTRTGGTDGYNFPGNWTMKEENGVLTMTANFNQMNTQFLYFVCTFDADTNEYTVSNTGSWNFSFSGIEVNGKDITDQLTKVK